MRERLLNAPAWVLALVSGATFGGLWALVGLVVDGRSWTAAVVVGAIAGVVFGSLMGPVAHRQNRRVRAAAAQSPEGLSPRVRRAASRGPVPEEPGLRAAAHRLALAQLAPVESQRVWGPLVFLLAAVPAGWLAVTDSPWWWFMTVLFVAAAAWHRYTLLRLRRRAAVLASDPHPQER